MRKRSNVPIETYDSLTFYSETTKSTMILNTATTKRHLPASKHHKPLIKLKYSEAAIEWRCPGVAALCDCAIG